MSSSRQPGIFGVCHVAPTYTGPTLSAPRGNHLQNRGPVGVEVKPDLSRVPKPLKLKGIYYDGAEVLKFLRGVAYAKAAAKAVGLQYRETEMDTGKLKDSVFAPTRIWEAFKPAHAEVVYGDPEKLRRESEVEGNRLLQVFYTRLGESPAKAHAFLLGQEQIRADCKATLQEVLREAQNINQGLTAEIGRSIRVLSTIRLTSTILVKGLSIIPGLGPLLADLGYGLSLEVIDDASKASEANVGLVMQSWAGTEVKDKAGEVVWEKLADKGFGVNTEKEFAEAWQEHEKINDRIKEIAKRRSERIPHPTPDMPHRMKQSYQALTNQMNKSQKKLAHSRNRLGRAAGMRVMSQGLSIFFIAQDLAEAIEKHQKAVQSSY